MTQLQQVIIDIFGEYEPIERTYTVSQTDSIIVSDIEGNQTVQTVTYEVPQTEYMFNWSWAAGVVLFSIVLYSFLRMVGGLLKCKI